MFDEGSPKASHGALVALGAVIAIAMLVAASGASITYRTSGREIELTEGPVIAQFLALTIPPLLLAWRRGYLAGNWPLHASLAASLLALLFLLGDWATAWRGAERDLVVTERFYLTLALAAAGSLVAAVALMLPVVERSDSEGHWRSRRDSPP